MDDSQNTQEPNDNRGVQDNQGDQGVQDNQGDQGVQDNQGDQGTQGDGDQGVVNPILTADDGASDGGNDDGGNGDGAAAGAPEQYEAFTDADGNTFSPEQVSGFVEVAKELNLPQESAQKMFQAVVPTARQYLVKDLVRQANEWGKAAESDTEFGGAAFKENMSVAKSAYKQYATPALQAILNQSGLCNHPEVVRLFYRVGKAMSQDTGVSGEASAAVKRRRYPNSNMVVD